MENGIAQGCRHRAPVTHRRFAGRPSGCSLRSRAGNLCRYGPCAIALPEDFPLLGSARRVQTKRHRLPVFPALQLKPLRRARQGAPRVLQIGSVEALGKPTIDWRQQIARLLALSFAPKLREAGGTAQLKRLRLLSACNADQLLEACFALSKPFL